MPRTPTPKSRVETPLSPRWFRPHIEWLESRQQPGETFGFGFLGGALAGTTLDLFSLPLEAIPPAQELIRVCHPLPTQEAVGGTTTPASWQPFASSGTDRIALDHQVLPALVQPMTHSGDFGVDLEEMPILPITMHQPPDVSLSGLTAPGSASIAAAADIGPSRSGTVLSAAVPGTTAHALNEPANPSLFVPSGASVSHMAPNSASFDPWSGTLFIRGDGAGHTIQEAFTSSGFLEVTLDNQPHSSDPASTAFDPLLTAATAAHVTGIQLDAGSQDALLLGSQQLAGGLTVTAPGATVVTQDVSVGGPLVVQAGDITVHGALRGSAVTLAATAWVNIEDTGRVVAASGDTGGRLAVFADKFVNTGQLHADGSTGGSISAEARNILNAGSITAGGTDGAGGTVAISFTGAYIDTAAALTSANGGDAGPGGHVLLNGGTTGHLFSSGRQQVTGSVGGAVDLLGREVVLDGGAVDVSGANGGGSIRVGQVANLLPVARQVGNLPQANAQAVTVTAATTLRADALHAGNGGQVAVWADQDSTFAGMVSARGGPDGGAGGFIDVSSQGGLSYAGAADAGAPAGKAGTLQLDPKNLIVDANAGVFPQFNLIDPHPTAGGHFGSQVAVRSNGNIIVTNPDDNFAGAGAGAVYLFNGLTSALIGSLVGSNPGDHVGGAGVTPLPNGNYVVGSPSWNGMLGAATWGSDRTGVSGIVSAANSLVGANPGDQVGSVTPLSNGNYLVVSPNWNANQGAVTWGSGSAGIRGIISAANSLVGANPGDYLGGVFLGLVPLSNGNYLVKSGYGNRGSVTWGNGSTGVSGIVSAANSLVGSNPGDGVGYQYVYLSNGSYVVVDPFWNGNRGAVTWGSASAGVTGTVSAANSLVGSDPSDRLGDNLGGVIPLSNGSYVVLDPFWNGNRGAVTWGSGSAGVSGTISAANSLVGSNPGNPCYFSGNVGDCLGYNNGHNDIAALSNGSYVVGSPNWNGGRGAATWGSGSAGVSGTVSATNSLVGSNSGDQVGAGVGPLRNGNYVVSSPSWNGNRGAVTWGNGNTGVMGAVSATNSLIGATPGDQIGDWPVVFLANGNYLVPNLSWNGNRGAVTWGNGSTGVSGMISTANSLVGSSPNDFVGTGVGPLRNGNYVVASSSWNGGRGAVTWGNGSTGVSGTISTANSLIGSNPGEWDLNVAALSNGNYAVVDPSWNGNRGAVTWASGSTGINGTISEANSLVGANPNDQVGKVIVPLSNGNYVVGSPNWNGGRGAATWGNGSTGTSGTVSAANSLVGSNPGDWVSCNLVINGACSGASLTPLNNGNYLVRSRLWDGNRGAVTWGSGSAGVSGPVSATNSLVGASPGDQIGGDPFGRSYITLFPNGNYVIGSPAWNGVRGAVTWGSGSAGVSGIVSTANSLVGSNPGDQMGIYPVVVLNNGNYLVLVRNWNGGRGAVTWVSGTTGQTLDGNGTITPQNSLVGMAANVGLGLAGENLTAQTFLAASATEGSGRVTSGQADPNGLTYGIADDQTLTITPNYLTRTLNTGTAVVLQASNDITVDDPITVHANGHGGALTLQAGRSILLNASITTDNGPLTLIANDTRADGVVDSQRDPGSASIVMAGGTTLDTGTAPLGIELRDGAGLTHADSRAINLQTLSAGSVTVINTGPDAGSDIRLGAVTTSGPQSYLNPHGLTTVTADLTTGDSPITFTDSVVINDGVNVDTGFGTVNFAGTGTQTLQTGAGVRFANVNHTGSGTLQLTSGLTVTGTLLQSAGTFDANDQPVTVSGAAVLTGGTYLTGTAPQTFAGGLVLTAGTFTSSTGPMTVRGGVTLTGGTFSGQGSVDQLTVYGGTVAPGTDMPGVLRVAGAVSFNPLTTFTVLLDGTHAGRDYSQLRAAGPVNLGGSTLQLVPGFEPPLGRAFKILATTGGIQGTFAGLPEGAVFDQAGFQFQITYHGGARGRDVVLTRVA